MRSNPSKLGTSYQLSAEVYRFVRNAGLKSILRYKDKTSGIKASLVVCDEEWNIKAVGMYGASGGEVWKSLNIPVVHFNEWRDTYPAALELIELAKNGL